MILEEVPRGVQNYVVECERAVMYINVRLMISALFAFIGFVCPELVSSIKDAQSFQDSVKPFLSCVEIVDLLEFVIPRGLVNISHGDVTVSRCVKIRGPLLAF